MRIISGIMGAGLVTVLYYMAVYAVDRKRELGLYRYKGWVVSRCVLLTGSAAFGTVCMIVMRKDCGEAFFELLLCCFLIVGMAVLCVTDYKKHVIPNRILLLLLLLWVLLTGIAIISATEYGLKLFTNSLLGGITGGMIFLLGYLLSGRQLGAGDVKLAFVMGLYLTGERIIRAIAYGILLCLLYSVVQLLRKKIGLKDGVPLAPFLYVGVLLTFLIMR